MKHEIKSTADGSSTIHVPELKEHYHSINGAVQESMHIFIRAGLFQVVANPINILEVGFGTGLNALLTLVNSERVRQINYHAVEFHPLEWEVVEKLNYEKFLNLTIDNSLLFKKMHISSWGNEIRLHHRYRLSKFKDSITEITLSDIYHLVYYDAFAPAVQPELWTETIFSKLFKCMSEGGILVTYCAKGEVRRCMQKAGFMVERLPGPPGKREILRARKLNFKRT
jgi:tRNA U34 5-methylaminomethyl-2-thiouridine-forming methyltransferase MnmC